jgi:hypothetical protein
MKHVVTRQDLINFSLTSKVIQAVTAPVLYADVVLSYDLDWTALEKYKHFIRCVGNGPVQDTLHNS